MFGKVEVKKPNKANLGFEFEDEVAVSMICALKGANQGLAKEMLLPDDKFNDIVIKEYKHVGNQTIEAYSFYQLKHRDSAGETLTWNSLIDEHNNNPLYLKKYFDSYEKLLRAKFNEGNNVIRELCIVTTAGLTSAIDPGLSSLPNLITQWDGERVKHRRHNQKPKDRPREKPVRHITKEDTSAFFCKQNDVNLTRGPLQGERFKFTDSGINEVAGCFSNVNTTVFKEFLELLVFYVNVSHVTELKKENNKLLRLFFPFHLNEEKTDSQEKCCEKIKESLLASFTDDDGRDAEWVTEKIRREKFRFLRESFKSDKWKHRSDSTNYEPVLDSLTEHFELQQPTMFADLGIPKRWIGTKPLIVYNINSTSSDSDATTSTQVLALETFAILQHEALLNQSLVIQVNSEEGVNSVGKYFTTLSEEVKHYEEVIAEMFFCIIVIAPEFEAVDSAEAISKLLDDLSDKKELRRWIQFIIITQQSAIPRAEKEGIVKSIDGTLKWEQLSTRTKEHFYNKELLISHGGTGSLKRLGFDEMSIGQWLHPRALSELILYDTAKKVPLNLGLSKKDTDLGADYVEREILIPLEGKKMDAEKLKQSAKARKIKRIHQTGVKVHESKLFDVSLGVDGSNNKLLIVVDDPGKGKSWLLSSLANRFLDNWSSHPSHLLMRVNLREINQWKEHESCFRFLLEHSKAFQRDPITNGNSLTLAILNQKYMSEPGSIFVLLDGYDEISEEERKTTKATIDDLLKQKGIKRVILTSRPEANFERDLERHFGQLSLYLKNFERDDQIRYLTKRWTLKLQEKNSSSTKELAGKIEKFTEALVNCAGNALKDESKTFLDIPLQCCIFSECFFKQLTDYLASSSETVPEFDDNNFEILSLYDRFYEAKLLVLMHEKADMPLGKKEVNNFLKNELKEFFLVSLMRLAIVNMLKQIDDAMLVHNVTWGAYRSKMKDYDDREGISEYGRDLKRALKLGIVQCPEEDNKYLSEIEPKDVKFLHRTFAEYFLARALSRNLTQTRSDLLDGAGLEKFFGIFSERILVATEFAGVRRFLDGMLAKYLPPSVDRCPFANQTRSEVLEKWPVIGHEKFNEKLAKSIILKNDASYTQLTSFRGADSSNLTEEDYQFLRNQVGNKHDLASIIKESCKKVPHITTMLIKCIKEYASRKHTSNEDKDVLAYCVTLSALTWVLKYEKHRYECNEAPSGITFWLLHWFDPAVGLPTEANQIFSKWKFIFLSVLSRETQKDCLRPDLIAPICEMIEYHKNDPNFEENINAIVSRLLFTIKGEQSNSKSARFFVLDLSNTEFWFKPREIRIADRLFEEILLRKDLSSALLQRLADFLANNLSQHIQLVAKYPIKPDNIRDYITKAGNLDGTGKTNKKSYEKFLLQNTVLPYAFIETVNFFMGNASKLPEATITSLLNVSLEYIVNTQKFLFQMNYLVDLSYIMSSNDPAWNGVQESERTLPLFTFDWPFQIKVTTISTMLWYFLVAEEISSYCLSDTRAQTERNMCFTKIFQESLTSYAHSRCCSQCQDKYSTGLGIHFPRDELFNSDLIDAPFEKLFADKLKFLWDEKGENQFIDVLLRKYEFTAEDLEFERRISDQSYTPNESMRNWLRNAESHLRAIHLAKLPCLLFSDVVGDYIPEKLSPAGLNHLTDTLEALPLLSCENNSFKWLSVPSPVLSDLRMSILDAVMQEDAASPKIFKCKERTARIRALQEKLQ